MTLQNITKEQLKTGFGFIVYNGRIALGGQPKPEDLKELSEQSWTDVVNLRNQPEMEKLDFEMAETCQKVGLNYNHIPIIVDSRINKKALEKVHDLLSIQDKKSFVHCAAGTRAKMALMAHLVFSGKCKASELQNVSQDLDFKKLQILPRLLQVLS